MKNFFYFLMLCAYVLASVGGFGYAAYGGSWPVAIAVLALAFMAFPTARKYFEKLTE